MYSEASEYIKDCTEIHTENHFSCDELPIDDSVEECKKKSSSRCSFGHKQRWNMARIGLSFSEESSACACGTAKRACVFVSNQPPKVRIVTTTTQLERKREIIFVDLQLVVYYKKLRTYLASKSTAILNLTGRLYQRNAESKILPPRRKFYALVVVVKRRSSTRSCLTQRVVAAAKDRGLAVACSLCAALRSVQESCAAGKSVISLIMQWTAVCTAELSSLVRRCGVYGRRPKDAFIWTRATYTIYVQQYSPQKERRLVEALRLASCLVSVDSTSIIQRKRHRRPRRLAFIHCIYPTPHDLFASPESHTCTPCTCAYAGIVCMCERGGRRIIPRHRRRCHYRHQRRVVEYMSHRRCRRRRERVRPGLFGTHSKVKYKLLEWRRRIQTSRMRLHRWQTRASTSPVVCQQIERLPGELARTIIGARRIERCRIRFCYISHAASSIIASYTGTSDPTATAAAVAGSIRRSTCFRPVALRVHTLHIYLKAAALEFIQIFSGPIQNIAPQLAIISAYQASRIEKEKTEPAERVN
uniref:Uncharacterized protein n=1 Tax=Trichogramma kaykai TaxID=54128 RepID=A0ABD2X6N0_9HYME